MNLIQFIASFIFILVLAPCNSLAEGRGFSFNLAVSKDLYDSGILAVLLPPFEKRSNTAIRLMPAGPDELANLVKDGKVDAAILSDPDTGEDLLKNRYGSDHLVFMHTYLVLLGPASAPAGIKGEKAKYAMYNIAMNKTPFLSRGEGSESDRRIKKIWSNIDVKIGNEWYFEAHMSMKETILLANKKRGYVISDKLTYELLKNDISIITVGEREDDSLKMDYAIITVDPDRHLHVRYGLGQLLMGYLVSEEARKIIENYGKKTEKVFYPKMADK